MGGQGLIEVFIEYYPLFINGLLTTLFYAFIAVLLGSILGIFITMLNFSKFKFISKLYVTILRGTPILAQLYIAYYFMPVLIPSLNNLPKSFTIIFALVLNSSAYVSEIFRGGINSVDVGQSEAAQSLGMTRKNTMIKIVLPQAIKNIIPSLGNEYITMIKETSLASSLAVSELMYVKTILANKFLFWQPLIIIACIYLLVTIILSYFVEILEKRLKLSE
ncbi:MAG: amino acid ABC transporter permease [Erysipelotrichaceae bacterium]|nr:amino acid ABC transporter permease [Erysipelotrichaceae bacterium]